MAEAKKYYWLRLKKDFFSRHDIRIIESMPNGKEYVLFYLKLMAESVSHEGCLRFSDTIPYDENMLATITNTNVDIVRAAMGILQQLNLMEVMDDKTIFMTEIDKLIGSELDEHSREMNRIRQQRHREKLKLLSCNVTERDITQNNGALRNAEKEIEIEKEIDINNVPTKSAPKRFKKPSIDEIREYCSEKGITNVDAEHFFDYYESNGWKVGRNPMKDWKATVRNWGKNGKTTTKPQKKEGFTSFDGRNNIDYDELERRLLKY